MYVENLVELSDSHVLEVRVAEKAGVVDDDVDRAKRLNCGIDDDLPTFTRCHRLRRTDSRAARRADLGHHFVRGYIVEVVDNDGRT